MPKAGTNYVELTMTVTVEGIEVAEQRATIAVPPSAGISEQVVAGLVKVGVIKTVPRLSLKDVVTLTARLAEIAKDYEDQVVATAEAKATRIAAAIEESKERLR